MAPWWWFLREPKHVGATIGILIVLIFLWFYNCVHHCGTIKSALMVHTSRAAFPHEPNVCLSPSIITVYISKFFFRMICYVYLDIYYFVSAEFIFVSHPHIEQLWALLPVRLLSLKICTRITELICFTQYLWLSDWWPSRVRSIECCICKRYLMCYILTPMGRLKNCYFLYSAVPRDQATLYIPERQNSDTHLCDKFRNLKSL
jgi:hypothetical protein